MRWSGSDRSPGRAAPGRGWRGGIVALFALLSVLATLPTEGNAQAEPGGRIQVLFLGDDRLHNPFLRAKEILPVLANNGIDMVYSADPSVLSTESLNRFHTLIFFNNQPMITPDQLSALLGFIENGGGLVALHSASAAFQNSEEYIRLVGASFRNHGMEVFSPVTVASNAGHAALMGVTAFESEDETYFHSKHNPVHRTVLQVRRHAEGEEPWTWVKPYGDGRVFYTASGHDERTWGTEGFQQLVVQATKWTAGSWAENLQPNDPVPTMARLDVPLPNYTPGAPWGTLSPSIFEAPEPMQPAESVALTMLRPGFSMQLFAQEPMVRRIIDFTWDERGRMWAAETNDYPNRLLDDGVEGGDRILILEDTNGDGMADKSTTFADGLNLVTTIALIDGGLIVGQAPHIFFMQDTNGDDVADVKRQIMTGFPRNDTHGQISNFRYSFDNQILASVGYNGFRGTVGDRTYGNEFSQGYFTFTPDGQQIDYLARTSNNTWGVAQTEDGFIFGSTANGRASQTMTIPGRYYYSMGFREPVLPGIADRNDVYPVRAIQQVDQFGLYTAGSAHEIYTARAFPQEYWNRVAFEADPTANFIGTFDIRPNGSTFATTNSWNFLASRDAWMAPVQVKVGPDGALWVSDFYTLVAQHNPVPRMTDAECCENGAGNAYETPNRDAEHGRIYRIVYDGAPDATPMRLDNATPTQLVAALENDNQFWRFTAQRLLVDRGNRDVVPMLVQLLDDHTIDELGLNVGALHALWTLHGLGAYSDPAAMQSLRNALYHPSVGIRRAALQALPRNDQLLVDILDAGILPNRPAGNQSIQDTNAAVRLEALLAISELPTSATAAQAIRDAIAINSNVTDRWIPDAVAIAAAQHNPGLALELLQRPIPQNMANNAQYLTGIRSVVQLLARQYAVNKDVEALLVLLEAVPQANQDVAIGVFAGIAGSGGGGRGGGGPQGQGGQQAADPPFRQGDWNNQQIRGWPQGEVAVLTPAQQTRFTAAARAAGEAHAVRFTRVATALGIEFVLADAPAPTPAAN